MTDAFKSLRVSMRNKYRHKDQTTQVLHSTVNVLNVDTHRSGREEATYIQNGHIETAQIGQDTQRRISQKSKLHEHLSSMLDNTNILDMCYAWTMNE